MMVGQNADAVSNPNLLGDAAEGAKDRILTGRTGESGQEVMLHKPEVIEANLVGQLALIQGFFI